MTYPYELMEWAVTGSPIGYSSGPAEQEWKARIKAVVPAAPRSG